MPLTLPNVITTLRFLLVPVVIWGLSANVPAVALAAFVVAGISDGLDGFIARRFNQRSELGAWLDPAADKLLLVTVYVALGVLAELPLWLVIMVVSRDVLIVSAVVLSSLVGNPLEMRPLLVSKANTVVQIVLAAVVLTDLAFETNLGQLREAIVWLAACLTLASGIAYVRDWNRYLGSYDEQR